MIYNFHFSTPLTRIKWDIFSNNRGDKTIYLVLKKTGTTFSRKEEEEKLFEACKNGDLQTIKLLIEEGVNIEVRFCDEDTPLTLASRYGHLEIVKFLIEKGTNINAQNKIGNTDLIESDYYLHFEIANSSLKKELI